MAEVKQRTAAKEFVEYWQDRGKERAEGQKFWLSLLRDVFGINHPERSIDFEIEVQKDSTKFADGYIYDTKVLIEQKGKNVDLTKSYMQSDGVMKTPFEQAMRYRERMPYSMQPKWVVICNFQEFHIYDMEKPNDEPYIILLSNLEEEYNKLSFLVDKDKEHLHKEIQISVDAGKIIGKLYDAFLAQYVNKTSEETLKSLNRLCVRLVFCMYAEDSGIFEKDLFFEYIKQFEAKHLRDALINLFKILDTKDEDRSPYLNEELQKFPYVNGGLFTEEDNEIPKITEDIKEILYSACDFNWKDISPTIFGAVFESTLNPETRRSGGMHYTSIENIHKVIDPLFLDDLKREFYEISKTKYYKTLDDKLSKFQDKLASLTFLDPACGSGNFLTETYLSLRKLENDVIEILHKQQKKLELEIVNPIKVSISQFFGIEINDFAVSVAKTALWIAEYQMMEKTETIIDKNLKFLPLKTYPNIVEGNALRINWEDVIPKEKLSYIMGNPPFVGARLMTPEQKSDMLRVFGEKWKNLGNLDYVASWYKKAIDYIQNTKICSAFVSTNSITQGEQVPILWKPFFEQNININFAYKTFCWDSESNLKAHVYCVIIGFGFIRKETVLYSNDRAHLVKNINAYLNEGDNIIVESRKKPLQNIEPMIFGSMPNDGGGLLLSGADKDMLLSKYPKLLNCIKLCIGADEYINGKKRYCLWLKGINPQIYRDIPEIKNRLTTVKESREKSNRETTKKLACTPYLFGEIRQPYTTYLIVPSASSKQRQYIPIGFMSSDIIATNLVLIVPNATLYNFGILTSGVHMAWMRTVCGRLGDGYRYSVNVVYNNFPWCNPTNEQKTKIEKTAQGILDARALYPDRSLADLYDELTMPQELRKAHQENDKAVMEAYGFKKKDENGKTTWLTESETVSQLMQMYQELTKENAATIKKN